MNFVIVSVHFFPQADAESFCSTRFATALAKAGHNVQVVTIDAPRVVSDDVYSALVDERIKINRVKIPPPSENRLAFNCARLRYFTYEQEARVIAPCIAATRAALQSVDAPILVSRTHPLCSAIIAWHCRKHASKWIAHLSDPLPWFYWNSFFGRLRYHFERLWMKRVFRNATGISVTCEQVCRFFHENFGELFDRQHTFVTTHIGDNLLKKNRRPWTGKLHGKLIACPGTIYADRGANALADAVEQLNDEGVACTCALVGGGDPKWVAEFSKRPHVQMMNDYSPEMSLSLTDAADVLFVSDFESTMTYSPRIMSKFVYQIFEDKPMVVRAPQVSAQHDYCRRFPESGMFYADDANQQSLVEAIKLALSCDCSSIDRSNVRKCFSAETIADEFVRHVDEL